MTNQSRSRTLAVAVLLTLSHLGVAAAVSAASEAPNIVLIYIDDLGYGDLGAYGCTGTKRQGPLHVGFMEVRKNPPKKEYTKEELAHCSEELRKKIAKKNGHSKYFYINEHGEAVWLTDYDGDSMVDFIDRHKAEPFFLFWRGWKCVSICWWQGTRDSERRLGARAHHLLNARRASRRSRVRRLDGKL